MMYRNTFKLIISNFNLVWKILLYLLFSSVCVLGLAYACSLPIINLLHEQGIVTMFVDLFKEFSHSFNVYELLSGFVTLIGRTNVGKSTLLNLLVGEKVAAIANKVQTTRTAIKGIVNRENSQIIFIDTPRNT